MGKRIQIISEFDPIRRVLHVSAERPVLVDDECALDEILNRVKHDLVESSGDGRCYLMLDISRIVVEPKLAGRFFMRLRQLRDDYLYPDGLVRYGLQISGRLVRIDRSKPDPDYPALVRTSHEARRYIDRLRLAMRQKVQTTIL